MERTADTEILGCRWQKRIVNISLRVPGMVFLLRWASENDVTRLLASLQPFDPDAAGSHLCFQKKKGKSGQAEPRLQTHSFQLSRYSLV